MRAFSIIGLHHSGKTTAVERLVSYIKERGFSVSSIKDIHQENWTMEKTGSNSHRHLQASGTYVFARGFSETHLIWNRQLSLGEMLAHIDTDWVIIEGMKDEALPKIIAAKDTAEVDSILDDNVIAITGVVAEGMTEYKGIPCINTITDIEKLGTLVVEKVLEPKPQSIMIKFDGVEIPLNEWVTTLSTDIIKAFCQNLRGYSEGAKIEILVNSE